MGGGGNRGKYNSISAKTSFVQLSVLLACLSQTVGSGVK